MLYANALHHRADALSSIAALAGLCGRVCPLSPSSPIVHWRALVGPRGWRNCGLHHLKGRLGYLPWCHARGSGCMHEGSLWCVVEHWRPHSPEDHHRSEQREEWRLYDRRDPRSSKWFLHVGVELHCLVVIQSFASARLRTPLWKMCLWIRTWSTMPCAPSVVSPSSPWKW